jgi:hypothetical protein
MPNPLWREKQGTGRTGSIRFAFVSHRLECVDACRNTWSHYIISCIDDLYCTECDYIFTALVKLDKLWALFSSLPSIVRGTMPLNVTRNVRRFLHISCYHDRSSVTFTFYSFCGNRAVQIFYLNLLLFASCTDTFSKWCKITRGMKRSAQ